jgi:hypothetical protein
MDVQDIHVGNHLIVSSMGDGGVAPFAPNVRDPVCIGVGPAAIPGSMFCSGVVMIGSPLSYPAIPEAALMVSRASLANPLAAKVPSIFKVTTKANVPPTPLDVMIGDPGVGMVGMTLNTAMINIIDSVQINIVTPTRNSAGNKAHAGASQRTGAEVDTGAETHTGVNINNAKTVDNTTRTVATVTSCPIFKGKFFTGKAKLDKGFDIEHPTRKGKRVRHICVEGPESAIYIRGKLKGTHIIDIPDYWQGLVDYDTITVNLTPCGKPDLSLYVKEIRDDKIILSSDHLTQVECFYHVWGNRIGPELHVEYDGESPADYPGDQSGHSIAGYTYDKEEA